MGGPFERTQEDNELTTQVQWSGSREYMCTHLLKEGEYKIKIQEIKRKSV
jgi:hypothetical protein